MAVLDRLKEEIGLLKGVAIFGAVFDVLTVVWLVSNYRALSEALSSCVVVFVVILTAVISLSIWRMYHCFALLEAA